MRYTLDRVRRVRWPVMAVSSGLVLLGLGVSGCGSGAASPSAVTVDSSGSADAAIQRVADRCRANACVSKVYADRYLRIARPVACASAALDAYLGRLALSARWPEVARNGLPLVATLAEAESTFRDNLLGQTWPSPVTADLKFVADQAQRDAAALTVQARATTLQEWNDAPAVSADGSVTARLRATLGLTPYPAKYEPKACPAG